MAWMETDYSKHSMGDKLAAGASLSVLGIMGETPRLSCNLVTSLLVLDTSFSQPFVPAREQPEKEGVEKIFCVSKT